MLSIRQGNDEDAILCKPSELSRAIKKDGDMKNNFRMFSFLFILITAVACSIPSKSTNEAFASPTASSSEIVFLTPSPMATSEVIKTLPLKTPSPATKQTATENAVVPREVKCFKLSDSKDFSNKIKGVIVFSGEFYGARSYLLDMQSGSKTVLDQEENEKLTGFAVSPDHKWLAYQKTNTQSGVSKIIMMSSDGKVVKTIDWNKSWRKIAGWLNGQILMINKNRGKNEIDSIVFLNTINNEAREIIPEYPNMWIIWVEKSFNWGSFNTSGTIYDPALTKVVYPFSNEQKSGVVLWDLENQKEITTISGGYGNQPKWMSTGEGFVINLSVRYQSNARMNEEFFYISKSGITKQVTRLNQTDGNTSIGFFNWSPDDKSIAFWLNIDKVNDYPDIYPHSPAGYPNRLAILDIDSGRVVDTCVPGDLSLSPPVWSLDGNYLVSEDYYGADFPFKGRVFLLDIEQGIIIEIGENAIPIGWMEDR